MRNDWMTFVILTDLANGIFKWKRRTSSWIASCGLTGSRGKPAALTLPGSAVLFRVPKHAAAPRLLAHGIHRGATLSGHDAPSLHRAAEVGRRSRSSHRPPLAVVLSNPQPVSLQPRAFARGALSGSERLRRTIPSRAR